MPACTHSCPASYSPCLPPLQAGSRWPDPAFMAATLAAFPDKGVASVEEARVRMGWLPQLTLVLAVGCKRLGTLQPQLLVVGGWW